MLKTQWGLCLLYEIFVPGKKTSTKKRFPSSGRDQTLSQLNFPARSLSQPQPPERAGKEVAAGLGIAHYYINFLGLLGPSWRSFAASQAHPAAGPAEQSITELPQFPPVARRPRLLQFPSQAGGFALKELKSGLEKGRAAAESSGPVRGSTMGMEGNREPGPSVTSRPRGKQRREGRRRGKGEGTKKEGKKQREGVKMTGK